MKIFCRLLILLIASCCSITVRSQVEYPVFQNRINFAAEDSQKLSFNLQNLNYIYNTEYFTKIPLSGTLFGYQLIPELQYQPTGRFVIRGGVYLQKEFGRPEYTSLLPTFSVKYKAKHSSFLLGTLEGSTAHGYIEPIYDYKLLINERLENGFQFFVDTKPYTHDFYINWRRAIHLGDPFKEEFDIGYIANVNVIKKERFELKLPVQLLYSHKGGQIDSTGVPLTSLVNTAFGVSLKFHQPERFLQHLDFDNYYVNYKDISGAKVQPFNEGNGYLSHMALKFKYFNLDLRYWNANGFINPRGNTLFSSVSEKHIGYTEKHRHLLLASIIYDKELFKNGFFDFRFSPYYDLGEKKLEYSYEMYFAYKLNVLLAKIRHTQAN